jgi:hypothetical protein
MTGSLPGLSNDSDLVDSLYPNNLSKEVVQSLLSENYSNMFSEEKPTMNKIN